MTACQEQIKQSYEVGGMTVDEIAADQDLDAMSVKVALMNCSVKFRKACGAEDIESDSLNFSNQDLKEINKVILETALSAQHSDGSVDYRTRLQAAMYVRDDKKGRKEVVKQIAGNTFNILSFNEQLQHARESVRQLKSKFVEV
jgi:hypothetical protein